jgi:transposase-like protein
MARERRSWKAEDKLRILEEARVAGHGINEVCRRYQISPTLFYQWERHMRRAALEALQGYKRGPKVPDRVVELEAEIQRLREAITEVTLENLALKKGQSG